MISQEEYERYIRSQLAEKDARIKELTACVQDRTLLELCDELREQLAQAKAEIQRLKRAARKKAKKESPA